MLKAPSAALNEFRIRAAIIPLSLQAFESSQTDTRSLPGRRDRVASGRPPTDRPWVAPFPNEIWFLIGALTFGCVLSALHILAAEVGHATKVHDLKLRIAKLQADYDAHLQAIADRDGDSDVIVLNEVPVHAANPAMHAA